MLSLLLPLVLVAVAEAVDADAPQVLLAIVKDKIARQDKIQHLGTWLS